MRRLLLTLFAAVLSATAFAQPITPSPSLAQLTAQDQAARSGPMKDINWAKVSAEDGVRRTQVRELIDPALNI